MQLRAPAQPFSTFSNNNLRLHSQSIEVDAEVLLIVYLHGSGGYGEDNLRQVAGGNVHGTRLWLKEEVASENPAFVVAPQIPIPQQWGAPDSEELSLYGEVLIELIDQLKSEYPIDRNRVYLMGQSSGVWESGT